MLHVPSTHTPTNPKAHLVRVYDSRRHPTTSTSSPATPHGLHRISVHIIHTLSGPALRHHLVRMMVMAMGTPLGLNQAHPVFQLLDANFLHPSPTFKLIVLFLYPVLLLLRRSKSFPPGMAQQVSHTRDPSLQCHFLT